MKIDEGSIDHNVVRLIEKLLEDQYDLIDKDRDYERGYILMTLGEISGMLAMAQAMKEVLKA